MQKDGIALGDDQKEVRVILEFDASPDTEDRLIKIYEFLFQELLKGAEK